MVHTSPKSIPLQHTSELAKKMSLSSRGGQNVAGGIPAVVDVLVSVNDELVEVVEVVVSVDEVALSVVDVVNVSALVVVAVFAVVVVVEVVVLLDVDETGQTNEDTVPRADSTETIVIFPQNQRDVSARCTTNERPIMLVLPDSGRLPSSKFKLTLS